MLSLMFITLIMVVALIPMVGKYVLPTIYVVVWCVALLLTVLDVVIDARKNNKSIAQEFCKRVTSLTKYKSLTVIEFTAVIVFMFVMYFNVSYEHASELDGAFHDAMVACAEYSDSTEEAFFADTYYMFPQPLRHRAVLTGKLPQGFSTGFNGSFVKELGRYYTVDLSTEMSSHIIWMSNIRIVMGVMIAMSYCFCLCVRGSFYYKYLDSM